MTKDAVAKNWTGLLTASGGRLYSDPTNVPGGGGSASYDWDEEEADFFVDPEKSTNGAGTALDPWQPSQAAAYDPSGVATIVEFLPGVLPVTTNNADRNPVFVPAHGGASGQPYIWRAQNKAVHTGVTEEQMTIIRRTSGTGSIFGIGGESTPTLTDFYLDGFCCDSYAGVPGNEVFQCNLWNTNRCKAVRLLLDGEQEGAAIESTQFGAIFVQFAQNIEVADCILRRQGEDTTEGLQVAAGIELYDCEYGNVHHNTIHNVYGHGIFLKGDLNDEISTLRNRGNRIHHNYLYNQFRRGLVQICSVEDDDLTNSNWWYQNIVRDSAAGFYNNTAVTYGTTEMSGVILQNNLFVRCENGIVLNDFVCADYYRWYSNIVALCTNFGFNLSEGESWASFGDQYLFDYNQWHSNTNGFAIDGGNRNFAYWQGLDGFGGQGNDEHGSSADPSFANAAANDFRLNGGSSALDSGFDFVGLLGTPGVAGINKGPFILEDQSDQIGCRTE